MTTIAERYTLNAVRYGEPGSDPIKNLIIVKLIFIQYYTETIEYYVSHIKYNYGDKLK